MKLEEAIAEVRRVTPDADPWTGADMNGFYDPTPVDFALAVIANAAISGDLIPLADHRLAVALVVQKAAYVLHRRANGAHLVGCGAEQAKYEAIANDILALSDADALAEVTRLREALTEISTTYYVSSARNAAMDRMCNLARAALQPKAAP